MDHQQIGIARNQWHGTVTAKVHISLIHQHHALRVQTQQLLHLLQRQADAGGGIGVGDDHASHSRTVGPGVSRDVKAQGFGQRHGFNRDAVEPAIHLVKAVADVGHQQRATLLEKGAEGMRQYLIGAVTQEHLLRRQSVVGRNGLAQCR